MTLRHNAILAFLIGSGTVSAPALLAQEADETAPGDSTAAEADGAPRVGHGEKGWELETADGKFLIQFQPRVQMRFSAPFDQDPFTFLQEDEPTFKVNRARIKIGGHGFEPWLKYYFEYELAANALLDFKLSVEKFPGLSLRVGQWKVNYNRERVISSGRQELADRSLINPVFTVDRQQGIELFGRLSGGGAADFSYWAGVFTGTGRGSRSNDDDDFMWVGRLQWNILGRPVDFTGSDLERREKVAAILAIGGVTNRSPYTRFSQEGGGELPGFDPGAPGQHRVNQALIETALKWRGLSWQQELHWKKIDDTETGDVTTLVGNYAQIGYFFHGLWSWVPEPLELAARHSIYNPDDDTAEDLQHELSLAANWFFHGHNNKLTAEVSYFSFDEGVEERDGLRFRMQWDISF
jgi:hypothetical protein